MDAALKALREVVLHSELFHCELFQAVSVEHPAPAGHLGHAQACCTDVAHRTWLKDAKRAEDHREKHRFFMVFHSKLAILTHFQSCFRASTLVSAACGMILLVNEARDQLREPAAALKRML